MKPLIIIKRKTIETTLFERGLTPNKVMLAHSESGYMTEQIFNNWLDLVFVPHVTQVRHQLGDGANPYEGKGLLICDGFSAHISNKFFDVCEKLNLQVFFLPAHSSHITQPLDLCLFGEHKANTKIPTKLNIPDEKLTDSEMVEIICRLFTGWEKTATTEMIISAWRQAGAEFHIGGPSYNYITFSGEKARMFKSQMSIWNKENTKLFLQDGFPDELIKRFFGPQKDTYPLSELVVFSKKTPKEKTQIGNKTTIEIASFNSPELKKKVSQMKRPIEDTAGKQIYQLLLESIVSLDITEPIDNTNKSQRGRPKKEQAATMLPSPENYLKRFTFLEKLHFELESVGLGVSSLD